MRSNARRHLRVHGLRIKTRVRSRAIALPPTQPEAPSDIHQSPHRTKHDRISSGSSFSRNQPQNSNAHHGSSTSNQGDGEDPLATMLDEIEFVTPSAEEEDCRASNGRYRRRLSKDDAPLTEIPTECPKLIAEHLEKLIKPPSVWLRQNEGKSSDTTKTIIFPIPGAWPLYETQAYLPNASDMRSNAPDQEHSNSITDHTSSNTLPILKCSASRHITSSLGHTAQLNNLINSASILPAESPAYTSRPAPPASPTRPSLSLNTHTLSALPLSIQDKEYPVHPHAVESTPQAGVSRRDGTWIPTSLMRFSELDSPSTADEYDRALVDVKPGTPFSGRSVDRWLLSNVRLPRDHCVAASRCHRLTPLTSSDVHSFLKFPSHIHSDHAPPYLLAVHPNLVSVGRASPQDAVRTDTPCHPPTWEKRTTLPVPPVRPGSYHISGVISQRKGPSTPPRVHAAA